QEAAFLVGRHLYYYQPGLYIRRLISTGTGLKAWVFAAIKLVTPQFPISAELEGPVAENLNAINTHIQGPARDLLTSLVPKLLASGALNLKKWVAGVDLTADRAGLLVAHDLATATNVIRADTDDLVSMTQPERIRELMLYSISEQYLGIRQHLGIAVDS
ncbi:MAG: hypothetical protein FWD57_14415, partial [Polyangiaceae bacterium]|nr:hypothetical protein [Polyangiaceae bacterium]